MGENPKDAPFPTRASLRHCVLEKKVRNKHRLNAWSVDAVEKEASVHALCEGHNMREKSSARPNVYFHVTSDVFYLNNNNEGTSPICLRVTVRFNRE